MNENELWHVISGILTELEQLKQAVKELETNKRKDSRTNE